MCRFGTGIGRPCVRRNAFFDFWRAQNGYSSIQLIPGAAVSEARGADCRSGNSVLRFRVEDGGHEWYEAPRFDTTNAVWAFVVNRFVAAT